MASRGKYDLGRGAYIQSMDEKSGDYNLYIRKAERCLRENNGKPSTEEAENYYMASRKCEEIMAMNLSQRAVYNQWAQRKQSCEHRIREITAVLAPPRPTAETTSPELVYTDPPIDVAVMPGKADSTEDGDNFITRNANNDVPEETIRSWYQEKPETGFEAVIGMEDLKQRLMDEAASIGWDLIDRDLNISPVQSYFFYGPPGTGKTTFINAFAKEMMDQGFRYLQLRGSEIHNSLVGVAEKIVTAAFNEAIDCSPCVIFIDEVDGVCVNRSSSTTASHEKRLTNAFLEARNKMKACGRRVIFCGATNHPTEVDPAMLDSVKLIYVPLPDEQARASYFERRFGKITPEEGFSYADMASMTSGFSFRELELLTGAIMVALKHGLIEKYKVLDQQGKVDKAKTDLTAHEAVVANGETISRAFFEAELKKNPAKDKSAVLSELHAFEGNMSALG